MEKTLEFIATAILIGAGATVVVDLWALALKRLFGIAGMNWGLAGRWFGHLSRGRFAHDSIAKAAPIRGELALGWSAHYLIGIVFAATLLAIRGLDWARHPTLAPALLLGILTVAAPFFLMQPGMGAGIAASKTPAPNTARLRSLITHAVFGLGLYLSALLWAQLLWS